MPEPTVYDATDKFRRDLLVRERAAAMRLVNAYGGVYQRLQPQISALTAELEANPDMKIWRKLKLERLKELKTQIEAEVGRYGNYLEGELDSGAREAVAAAQIHSRQATQAALPGLAPIDAQIMGTWNRLPNEAIETLLGFMAEGSPLRENLKKLGPGVAEVVQQKMVQAIGLGANPREIARVIRKELGQGLAWSLRTARTTQINAYREATRANYAANSHIVKQWEWLSARDRRTCMSCIAMDGKRFPLSEPLRDHQNGRCVAVPVTVTYRELGLDVDDAPPPPVATGQQWFDGLSEAEQKAMMGKGKFEAWKAGKFEFSQLSKESKDVTWGKVLVEAPLKDLIGGKAAEPAKVVVPVESVENIVRQYERKIIEFTDHEQAILVGPYGNVIFIKDGSKSEVRFDDDEVKQFRGATLTHNHPTRGTSFSYADVDLALSEGLTELRAVGKQEGKKYLYSIRPDNELLEKEYQDYANTIIGESNTAVRRDSREKIDRKEVTIDQANLTHHHELWTRVDEELKKNFGISLNYTRREIDD